MCRFDRAIEMAAVITVLALTVTSPVPAQVTRSDDHCTDIVVGKAASVDGSVITSHTGCCSECRVHVVPARTYPPGAMAPVYYGLQDVRKPLHEYGKVIGHIPQVENTFAYFHTGYPQMNEHQLAIGESTLCQRKELQTDYERGCRQIMTIEQAQLFALQRCRTAREAIALITSLLEKYGFLPSCGPESEGLCIADPQEVWVLEVFSVGPDWDPDSGELGAVWAAQRVPDDHAAILPNWSIIKEIDLNRPDDFMASANHMQVAIDHGWYDPKSGRPFIWQEAYAPLPIDGSLGRLWLFYSQVAPSLKNWSTSFGGGPSKTHGYDPYHTVRMPLSYFPFSVKPEKKLSVQDVIAFQRSTFEGTIYDMTADTDWLVPDGKGGFVKSPLTTPFPNQAMRDLLDIDYHRVVSRGGYGMVAQLRGWLPAPIGGIYWFYLDNQHISTYVPIYAGVQDISPLYSTYDPDRFSEDSARWAIDFVDNLLYLRWQDAVEDVRAVRDPMEREFFRKQAEIEAEALKRHAKSTQKACEYLTEITMKRMEDVVNMYRDLRVRLITKYTNNKM